MYVFYGKAAGVYAHTLTTVKAGYPPHSLTLIPELPLESLGLKQGEQLIVTQKLEPSSSEQTYAAPSSFSANTASTAGIARSQVGETIPPVPTAPQTSGADYVEMEGGYLVHRVRNHLLDMTVPRRTDGIFRNILTDCTRRQLVSVLINCSRVRTRYEESPTDSKR